MNMHIRGLVNYILILLTVVSFVVHGVSQSNIDSTLVQFSGVVMTEDGDTLIPLPFVNIQVLGTPRGTYSDFDGFFSVVASKGDTIGFSAVGFKEVNYVIPDTLHANRYTIYQMMSKDTFLLPETVVYPWPSREHFKIEFLALDVESQLDKRLKDVLSKEKVDRMLILMPSDAKEVAKVYFKQQQKQLYYAGQVVSPIDPMAWIKFIKAWRAGRFKRKKK